MTNLVWNLATQSVRQTQKRELPEVEGTEEEIKQRNKEESYLLVFGSKNSGKTSIILRFLDRDEPPKPTIALEYTYARRAKGNAKEIGHIWELGGGIHLLKLLNITIAPKLISDLSLILVLDLSEPNQLWITLDNCLTTAKNAIENAIKNSADKENLTSQIESRVRSFAEHKDKEFIKPFPVNLIIIGGCYDKFQDFDPEKKKMVNKTLRFVSHSYGANLQYFSIKIETLVTRGRGLVSHLLFGTTASKGLVIDHNKPLFIPAGSDSLEEIGSPPMSEDDLRNLNMNSPLDMWRSAYCIMFPQNETKLDTYDDYSRDAQFKEEAIDLIRNQKDEELEKIVKNLARIELQQNPHQIDNY